MVGSSVQLVPGGQAWDVETEGSFHVVHQLNFEDLTAVRVLSSLSILGIVLIMTSLDVIEHHNKKQCGEKRFISFIPCSI